MTGTARRLLVGFSLMVGLFAVAGWGASRGIGHVRQTLHEVTVRERRVRMVLQLANAVRDQYAHEAHMILLENDSHLPMYRAARARVQKLTSELEGEVQSISDVQTVDTIRASSVRMDQVFRGRILPAIRKGDFAAARQAHEQTLDLVMTVQARADDLAHRFEQDIRAFEARAVSIQRTTYVWTVAMLVGATLLAALVGITISRSVAAPVAQLQAGAARLAQGDLDARIPLTGWLASEDEFGRLARQLNAMTEALKQHEEQLVQSERLAGIGRLAAGVAHELNNPLGVILGYVRLMQKRATDGLGDDLRIVEEETLRAKEIVDDLLHLARPGTGESARMSLREACEQIVERLRDTGRLGDVDVRLQGDADACANPRAILQVLTNLLANAVEAAGKTGRVRVEIEAGDAMAQVSVIDSGAGIEAAAMGHIFEPFFTTKPSGTGLGLAVSQAIARAHGGRIEAANEPAGGARFTLRVPIFREVSDA